MKPLLIVIAPGLAYLYILSKISRYRKDRGGRHGLDVSFDSMINVLTKGNYTEEGLRLFPWLVWSLVTLVLAAILALGLVARG